MVLKYKNQEIGSENYVEHYKDFFVKKYSNSSQILQRSLQASKILGVNNPLLWKLNNTIMLLKGMEYAGMNAENSEKYRQIRKVAWKALAKVTAEVQKKIGLRGKQIDGMWGKTTSFAYARYMNKGEPTQSTRNIVAKSKEKHGYYVYNPKYSSSQIWAVYAVSRDIVGEALDQSLEQNIIRLHSMEMRLKGDPRVGKIKDRKEYTKLKGEYLALKRKILKKLTKQVKLAQKHMGVTANGNALTFYRQLKYKGFNFRKYFTDENYTFVFEKSKGRSKEIKYKVEDLSDNERRIIAERLEIKPQELKDEHISKYVADVRQEIGTQLWKAFEGIYGKEWHIDELASFHQGVEKFRNAGYSEGYVYRVFRGLNKVYNIKYFGRYSVKQLNWQYQHTDLTRGTPILNKIANPIVYFVNQYDHNGAYNTIKTPASSFIYETSSKRYIARKMEDIKENSPGIKVTVVISGHGSTSSITLGRNKKEGQLTLKDNETFTDMKGATELIVLDSCETGAKEVVSNEPKNELSKGTTQGSEEKGTSIASEIAETTEATVVAPGYSIVSTSIIRTSHGIDVVMATGSLNNILVNEVNAVTSYYNEVIAQDKTNLFYSLRQDNQGNLRRFEEYDKTMMTLDAALRVARKVGDKHIIYLPASMFNGSRVETYYGKGVQMRDGKKWVRIELSSKDYKEYKERVKFWKQVRGHIRGLIEAAGDSEYVFNKRYDRFNR